MIVTGKKGQIVKQGIRIRISRPSSPSFVMHRRARAGPEEKLSEDFLRWLIRSFAVLFLVIFLSGQFLRWHISRETRDLERLITVHASVEKEHAKLLAQRNRLISKSRIAAVAAVRLELYLPKKEQEYHLY